MFEGLIPRSSRENKWIDLVLTALLFTWVRVIRQNTRYIMHVIAEDQSIITLGRS